jgi:hypothetical protein
MTPAKPNHERRAYRRRVPKGGVRVTCQLGALGLGPNVAVAVLDVSEGGARLAVTAAVPPGQEVEVTFAAPTLGRPVRRMAALVWCTPRDPGTWWAGARFDRRLPYAELTGLA